MVNTIISRNNAITAVRDGACRTTRRNPAMHLVVGTATLMLLVISRVTIAVTHPDAHTPKDHGDKRNHSGIKDPGKFHSEISEINTTEIDIDLLNHVAAQREQTAKSIIHFEYNEMRNQLLTDITLPPNGTKGIIYWMYRDQRVQDNWAVLYAQKLAIINKVPLHVVFCTPSAATKITLRQYQYMIEGLKEVQSEFQRLNIQFHFSYGSAVDVLSDFVRNHNIGGIIVDFFPLRDYMNQTRRLADVFKHKLPVIMVDAHNVVPCWSHSRIQSPPPLYLERHIDAEYKEMFTEFPPVIKHPFNSSYLIREPINWDETYKHFKIDSSVLPVLHVKAGYRNGIIELENFIKNKLNGYYVNSKDPMKNGLSNLSPFLHFGQISAQRVMLEVQRFSHNYLADAKRFWSEIYKRRERSDLYCYLHLENYDRVEGAQRWARCSLNEHRNDTRPYLYTRDELEKVKTHDYLWNAAQTQLMTEGKMHSLLRMYWGKKILEWTDTPENALATAIYLNNKYSLDGNDPNSYNGCMWAICGLHDRPSRSRGKIRQIYGKIRYIDIYKYRWKFDVAAYIKKYKL